MDASEDLKLPRTHLSPGDPSSPKAQDGCGGLPWELLGRYLVLETVSTFAPPT